MQASLVGASPPAREMPGDGLRPILSLQVQASFVAPTREATMPAFHPTPTVAPFLLDACEASVLDLCITHDRRAFYRSARGYMPTVEGLTAEGVSLRRHSLTLKYSFR